jgi:hypothetical protein
LATEQAAPIERSIEPKIRMAVIPDAIMMSGAESLNSVLRLALPRKLLWAIVNPIIRIITAEKLKYLINVSCSCILRPMSVFSLICLVPPTS